jgi:putative FmdB family regulatory protein
VPIYEYECKTCSLRFELKRRFSEGSGANCPFCHGEARRIFSPVAVLFKGPGFYVTDNAALKKNGSGGVGDGDSLHDVEQTSEFVKENKAEVSPG